jgi:hypothetical protein
MKKFLLLSVSSIVFCSAAFSAKPPQAVLTAFQEKFPTATDVDWSKEKSGEWEAEFELADDKEISASFTPDGRWLETETEMAFSELPAPIRTALQGKKIKETERIEKADGSIWYEVEVKRKEMIFDASGKKLQ